MTERRIPVATLYPGDYVARGGLMGETFVIHRRDGSVENVSPWNVQRVSGDTIEVLGSSSFHLTQPAAPR